MAYSRSPTSWRRSARLNGGKTVYWAASAHTADVPALTITLPPYPDTTFAGVGSFMRDWYGDRYRSIGFTFSTGTGMPAAPHTWFEHPLGEVSAEQFPYDLRRPAPRPVREWLHRPMLTRGIPEAGLASTMSGGTPAQWFDVIVHRRTVTLSAPADPAVAEILFEPGT